LNTDELSCPFAPRAKRRASDSIHLTLFILNQN
jgi:hypothetical protein